MTSTIPQLQIHGVNDLRLDQLPAPVCGDDDVASRIDNTHLRIRALRSSDPQDPRTPDPWIPGFQTPPDTPSEPLLVHVPNTIPNTAYPFWVASMVQI